MASLSSALKETDKAGLYSSKGGAVSAGGARKSPRPPLHLKNGPNMPLTTRKPRGVHCFKF